MEINEIIATVLTVFAIYGIYSAWREVRSLFRRMTRCLGKCEYSECNDEDDGHNGGLIEAYILTRNYIMVNNSKVSVIGDLKYMKLKSVSLFCRLCFLCCVSPLFRRRACRYSGAFSLNGSAFRYDTERALFISAAGITATFSPHSYLAVQLRLPAYDSGDAKVPSGRHRSRVFLPCVQSQRYKRGRQYK